MLLALVLGSQLAGSVVLDAVGDVMLDRYVGRRIDELGPGYPLEKVAPIFDKADLVAANLECPLTNEPIRLKKQFPFRANPSHVKALSGIDIVSLANNHTLDCGTAGLAETMRTLAKAGIASVGADKKMWLPLIVQRNGLKIAFFAFSDFPEVSQTPNAELPTYYAPGRMSELIGFVRPQVDVIVVFAHWGVEGGSQPSGRQRSEAKEMADAGADLIIGSHPHVLQPVERIGKTVVAYSMGNFVFDAPNAAQAKTAIFRFRLTNQGVTQFDQVPCEIVKTRPEPVART
ncbi:MAG TPA: CapA family protein [Fimbriimonadaceae bacterium]|nr:CapA family protein [Fimbriimonadaceae bacterium]